MKSEGDRPLSKLSRLLTYLQVEFDRYPYHEDKDPKYFNRLIGEFPQLDIEEELRQYHAWILDQPDHKKIYFRSRFRSWLKTSQRFKESQSNGLPPWLRRRRAQNYW